MTSVPPQSIRDTDQNLQDCLHPSCYLFIGKGGNREKRKLLNSRQVMQLKQNHRSSMTGQLTRDKQQGGSLTLRQLPREKAAPLSSPG